MSLSSFGKTLVLAPHPDDETLGCGATLLRLKSETNHPIFWLLMTRMSEEAGYTSEAIHRREVEIANVAREYGFTDVIQLPYSAATLDTVPLGDLIRSVADVFEKIKPSTLLLPFSGDIHSDHSRSFAAGSACSKWFRRNYLKKVLSYEVLSETGLNLDPSLSPFVPNYFVSVSEEHLKRKIEIMKKYESEMAPFPFPRSPEAIESQSKIRGSQCGAVAAEAFMLLKEIV